MKGTIFTILGVLAVAINPVWVLADTFDLSWYTFDGSYTLSTGGGFSLGGTVGQPDASTAGLTGGGFSLTGGFWPVVVPAVTPGDLNCDGSVNFGDINPFVLYLSNFSSWQATYPNCPPDNGDINSDGTYPSFRDINPFVALLSGSG